MCGRAHQNRSLAELAQLFGCNNPLPNLPARWNAAPTHDLAVVRFNPKTGERSLDALRWGLVPVWAKDLKIGVQCINARAETVESKPAFRDAFARRRCLVPLDGFYEWEKLPGGGKQPWAIGMADGSPLVVAGLWENWKSPEGAWTRTFAVLTTDANPLLRPIHPRMPVILDAADWPAWLGQQAVDRTALMAMMRPFPEARMRAWRVSDRVGNIRNDDPSLLEPLAA